MIERTKAAGGQAVLEDSPSPRVKEVTSGARSLVTIAGVLVFLAGVQLFVFSEKTASYFAWTIDVPLTAAFLGASYWGSAWLQWASARERAWANARPAVPTAFVFTTLTLVATLLHLELFHLGASFALGTRVVTWIWIAVYAAVPPIMAIVVWRQRRAPGGDPARSRPLPAWMRTVMAVHAAGLLSIGTALFVAPERFASLWPWPLTPLTGRAVAAWTLSIGVAAAWAVFENDLRRVRAAAGAYVALAVLQGIALLRFPDAVDWGAPQAAIYVAILLSMLVTGLAAIAGLRDMREPT
jgi:hypothetical protein